jgi:NAD(P)-dependent dehydrogenase (short-subunit alcohol dehydrogenase family)
VAERSIFEPFELTFNPTRGKLPRSKLFVKEGIVESRPVVLITGCSTGIGFNAALLLARRGHRVFATMRDLKKAGPLRKAAAGLALEILPLDVDKALSVKRAVATLLQRAGRIDVLVNNAGWGAFGALEEFSDVEIRAQYETNVFGLLRVTRAVLPAMRAQKSGRILNIGSLAGKMTFAGIGLYCSTKYAVEAATESLRLEVRPFNIQVAVVEPGTIRTPFKVNRRKAVVFLAKKSAYQKVLERILHFGNNPPASAPGPARVAEAVLGALQAPRMSIRYPVGGDAVWFPIFRWFMPDFLFDYVLRVRYSRFMKEGS